DWYDTLVGDEGSEYHREVILPGILRLLENPPPRDEKGKAQKSKADRPAPKNILDLACGQGVLCRKLAALGHTLTGLDAAEPLIAAARKRNDTDRLPIRYHVADATRLLNKAGELAADLSPHAFDAITLVLAIQNMTPLSPIWHACHTLLKPGGGGTLILVMMHPAFRVPRQSDWHWDPHTQTQSRLIRQYLSSSTIPIQTHPGLAAHGKDASATTHFHRPLQAYVNTLGNAGLLIDHLEEWPSHKKSEPGPRQKALDEARHEIPMFLALRAVKTHA
ncbi:MAG TPA: class I SAM-dependent methyltransferase, partial [Phycisphaerae bacterium]|nr:class I SAM-dependent methyltransferase [Phycisphaerae bacterium]